MSEPNPFDDLRHDQCKLMPPELVDRHNCLVGCLRTLEQQAPRTHEMLAQLRRDLARVRLRLTREHFQVGFIGENQIGKSSTFNNILGVRGTDEQPSPEGAGRSTTSAITRLHRATNSDHHRLFLRYLSEADYQDRRARLCVAVGIDPSLSDAKVEEELPRREQAIAKGQLNAQTINAKYLGKLLRSYRQFGRQVIGKAEPQEARFADRTKILTHNFEDDKGSPYLLLEDAIIEFKTDRLADSLELIDLPGLGGEDADLIDLLLTKDFLDTLDGALVCAAAQFPYRQVVASALQKLRGNFQGNLEKRVWVVYTRFDAMGPSYIQGDDKGRTVFLNTAELPEKYGIPLQQICYVSNNVFKAAAAATAAGRPFGRHEAAPIIGVDAEPEFPPRLEEVPGLKDPYRELLKDGGIGHLRTLLADTLVKHVAERTRAWIDQQLTAMAAKVLADLEFLRQASSYDMLPKIQEANQAVYQQLQNLEGRTTFFDDARAELRKGLLEHFKFFFPEQPYLDRAKLPDVIKHFENEAPQLEERLPHLLRSKTIPTLYGQVGEAFQGLPAFRIAGKGSVAEAWEAVTAEDQADLAAWKGPLFPSFVRKDLFGSLRQADGNPFNGQRYRVLMYEKIRVAAFQAMHSVRVQLQRRLHELEEQLNELGGLTGAKGGLTGSLDFTALANQLRKVCPSP